MFYFLCFFSISPVLESYMIFLFQPTLFSVLSLTCALFCLCSSAFIVVREMRAGGLQSLCLMNLHFSSLFSVLEGCLIEWNRKSRPWEDFHGMGSVWKLCAIAILPVLCLCCFDTLLKWLSFKRSQYLKIWSAFTVSFSEGNWLYSKQ